MRRKIGFLLLVIGCIVLVAIGIRFFMGGGSQDGVLKITSTPSAAIFLNNEQVGLTPLDHTLPSGEYTIKLTPQSTVDVLPSWEGRISVGNNTLTYVNRDFADSELGSAGEILWLEKISSRLSELTITASPDGATVILDNETRGITPLSLTDVAAGDHSLTLVSQGFVTRTLKIKSTSGYNLNIAVQLALSSGTTPEATSSPTPVASPSGTTGTPSPTVRPTGSAVADPPKPYALIEETPVGFLRVRMEPSTAATEAGRVNPGEKYSILDEQGGWYEIEYEDDENGWISGQYATKVE